MGDPHNLGIMNGFVTVDFNGLLDHAVVGGEDRDLWEIATLGFRSCLYQHRGTWLFGGQALAAARDARADGPLLDAMNALDSAAGHGRHPPEIRHALPDALWHFVSEVSRRSSATTHLAVVVPDGQFFGLPEVIPETGQTRLETLHNAFMDRRPPDLSRSRFELIWRSVAALQAARSGAPRDVGDQPGSVLVISLNRKTYWTVIELSHWPSGKRGKAAIRIVRKPEMEDCDKEQAFTAQRMEFVQEILAEKSRIDFDALWNWTRSLEILATGMGPGSLAEFGVNGESIEHWSWPTPDGGWNFLRNRPTVPIVTWPQFSLPAQLRERIESFAAGDKDTPRAIIVECPAGGDMTAGFERIVRAIAPDIPVVSVTGLGVSEAALSLALALGRDPDAPAWLDEVPAIQLEVRQNTPPNMNPKLDTAWKAVIPGNQAIPAGETYHTPSDPENRTVTLAPGIEHIHLHLRRGGGRNWDERYSGQHTGHTIVPSDHERRVEPLARVRPLSGDARIEIVEHFPDGKTELLSGSRASMRWSEMSVEVPEALRSIPELYVFKASEAGWQALRPLLETVVASGAKGVDTKLKNEIYKCTNARWQDRVFPLGSDGAPPKGSDPEEFLAGKRLLAAATGILQQELENSVRGTLRLRRARGWATNRLHLPLTWLFTGCPESTVEILLDALIDPSGRVGRSLLVNENVWSAWAVYSGVGRAAQSDDALKIIFDNLVGTWVHNGGTAQDKFLLAAVTHSMARRVNVRYVLYESRERFDRVHLFLRKQLDNLLDRISDTRPRGTPNRSLELRYITMGYRGLCQVRYRKDWFPPTGEDAKGAHDKLLKAAKFGREFEKNLVAWSAPYLIGQGRNPTMPGGF